MANTTLYRYDSNRFFDSASFEGFAQKIGKTNRRKLQDAYEEVLVAAIVAAERAADETQNYIADTAKRVGRTGNLWSDFSYKVNEKSASKGSVSLGWVNRNQRYYDWQERGTYEKRDAARTGRFYHTGKTKAKGAERGMKGIAPMYAKDFAKERFHEEFNRNLRSIRG